jgi:cell wall-associated NlpC family hydrolase
MLLRRVRLWALVSSLTAATSLVGIAVTASPAAAVTVTEHHAVVAAKAVAFAEAQIGKPYRYGAAGPASFDCSGLTMKAWLAAGVTLAHYSGGQWREGTHVSKAQLQPGDLVFFGTDIHHVGIYIGSGKMIEAPHTGAKVRVSDAFRSDYAGAVRI